MAYHSMHKMKSFHLCYTLVILLGFSSAEILPRPRGVSLQHSSIYHLQAGTENWTCLDGLKTINFGRINDDYCDCQDGSDEPGTSACANGMFFCENVGHRPQVVGSSRVNDGICDCCDGADEYLSGSCKNTCQELGQAEQEERKSKAELHKRGAAKRAAMITKGKQMRTERETRRVELEQRLAEQKAIKEEKQNLQRLAEAAESEALEAYRILENEREGAAAAARAKDIEAEPQAQRIEAEAHFVRYDTNKDGLVEISELQVDMTLDRDRNGIVTIEEAKYFLDERDRVDLDAFSALSWPRIKPLLMLAEGIFKPPKNSEEELANADDDDATPADDVEHADADEGEAADMEPHDALPDDDDDGGADHDEYEDEADVGVGTATADEPPKVEYDPETQRLVDLANEARRATSDVDNELRQTEHEIKEIDDHNAKDYGEHDEFAALDGECFAYEDREYVYTLCPFDRASQKPRSGGSETTLGRWDSWIAEGDNSHAKMKYSHGSSCWNGPQRSAIVLLACGVETKINAVSEPNRCEYFYEMETPAACYEASAAENDENMHDEL